jgi:hypothetical protein
MRIRNPVQIRILDDKRVPDAVLSYSVRKIRLKLTRVSVISGKPVSAVVEHVRDGTTLRVLLIPDFIQASLTGQLFIYRTDHSVVDPDPDP